MRGTRQPAGVEDIILPGFRQSIPCHHLFPAKRRLSKIAYIGAILVRLAEFPHSCLTIVGFKICF